MRAVVQRVARASVEVDGRTAGVIGPGLLVLLGVADGDDESTADRMADKLGKLRVIADEDGRMNLAAQEFLVVPNFTVCGDTRRGNRPSFTAAAPPERANELYERVRERLGAAGGVFGASMAVELVNDGPVTLIVEV